MPTVREVTNLLLDGKLVEVLSRLRVDEGLSYDAVADRLRDEHGLSISRMTVQRWCEHYGIEMAEEKGA